MSGLTLCPKETTIPRVPRNLTKIAEGDLQGHLQLQSFVSVGLVNYSVLFLCFLGIEDSMSREDLAAAKTRTRALGTRSSQTGLSCESIAGLWLTPIFCEDIRRRFPS